MGSSQPQSQPEWNWVPDTPFSRSYQGRFYFSRGICAPSRLECYPTESLIQPVVPKHTGATRHPSHSVVQHGDPATPCEGLTDTEGMGPRLTKSVPSCSGVTGPWAVPVLPIAFLGGCAGQVECDAHRLGPWQLCAVFFSGDNVLQWS